MKTIHVARVVVLCSLGAGTAHASEFCVDTTAELQQAVASAQLNTGDDTIRIVEGTYAINSNLVYNPATSSGYLRISGGYEGDCSSGIDDGNALLTRLVAGAGVDFSIRNLPPDKLSALSYVALQGFETAELRTPTCVGDGNASLTLTNVYVSDGGTGAAPALTLTNTCGATRASNVLVRDSASDGLSIVTNDPDDSVDVAFLTLVDNPGRGLEIVRTGGGPSRMWNTIAHANGTDVFVSAGTLTAQHSMFQTAAGGGTVTGSNNLNTLPQLDASYYPMAGSPALDSGTSNVAIGLQVFDLGGARRVLGAGPDRGAYEGAAAAGAVITVTSEADAGAGSLRQAILTANASPNAQTIEFAIPGTCPRTISISSALPVTSGTLAIRGDTQAGSRANDAAVGFNADVCIVLRDANGVLSTGLALGGTAEVRGLAFSNFAMGDAISTVAGTGHVIAGNQFGGPVGAVTLAPNRNAIEVGAATNVTVGGFDRASVNLISGSTNDGVVVFDSSPGAKILSNVIGLDRVGFGALPNGVGVRLRGRDAVVSENLISGNTSHGVSIDGIAAGANTIENNRIGLRGFGICFPFPCTPNLALGNGGAGVRIARLPGQPASSDEPGSNFIRSNVIAYNAGAGVHIEHGRRNRVTGGQLYDNGGLGIDIGEAGHSPNDDDAGAPDGIGNGGMNAPIITLATPDRIDGTLASIQGNYRINLYASPTCDPSGFGEGRTFIGFVNTAIAGSGQSTATWTVTTNTGLVGDFTNQHVTAVAFRSDVTDPLSLPTGDGVSEFSACAVAGTIDAVFADGFE